MDEYISREMAVKKLQMQLLNLEADQDKGEYSELCENRGARAVYGRKRGTQYHIQEF